MTTIAELEAAANAACAAHDRALARQSALSDVLKSLDMLDELSRDEFLTDADRAILAGMNFAGAWLATKAQEQSARAESVRLADAADDAARDLNEAPEEAA